MQTSALQRYSFLTATLLAVTVMPVQAAVTVTISPATYTMRAGATKTFYSSVSGTTVKTVKWSVNGVVGGNATVGTISDTGLYTTPALVPAANVIKVRSTSTADATAFAESAVTLENPLPVISELSPNMVNIGTFTVTVKGRGFVAGSKVKLSDVLVATTFVSATELKVTVTDNTPRETYMSVTNPNPGTAVSSNKYFKIMPTVTLNVTPDKTTMRLGLPKQFYASVGNAVDKTVTWYVNDVKGGNPTVGTISETGLYSPPAVLPPMVNTLIETATGTAPGPTVNIKAVTLANGAINDTSVVTLQNAIPSITKVTPGTLTIGNTAQFVIDGTGFAPGATILLGSTPLVVNSITTARAIATGKANATVGGVTTISLRNPDPGGSSSNPVNIPLTPGATQLTAQQAARFLQRTTWGPTPAAIVKLQQNGIQAFLQEQFTAPVSDLPEPIAETTSITPAQRAFYSNAMTGQDQLRQRVAFALSQILVVSGEKTGQSNQLVPYMRILNRNAFGNYYALLKEVTLSPTMGRFLDMVNNQKANPARGIEPNENYARELLQLFTLGLVELNMDGSPKKDGLGNNIPSYTEDQVKQLAKVFTGWTYPTRPGETPRFPNPSYYNGPMLAFDAQHDVTQKNILLGQVIPPGRTAAEEIDLVINNIKQHPNVPPFVALRLIQRLTMGNPSPAYIQRVATVFQQTQGDLWATTKAIVTDAEAETPQPQQGKLKEPILFVLSFLRSLDATVTIDHSLNSYANNMGQNVWFAPSVFNYFSPFFRANGQVAPEFQINTPSIALNRVNFIYRASRNGIGAAVQIDLSHLERLAADPPTLVEALNQALLNGTMSAAMKTSILTAINATTDVRTRARNAAYLVGSSSQFQVEP